MVKKVKTKPAEVADNMAEAAERMIASFTQNAGTRAVAPPKAIQFTPRQLAYLNAHLLVDLAMAKHVHKDRRAHDVIDGAHTAVYEAMREWWDKFEGTAGEGTWTIAVKTAFGKDPADTAESDQ